MTEQPREGEGEAPDPDEEPGEGEAQLPAPPSKDALDDIRFAVKRLRDAPLVVTLSGGPVESRYGPADLLGKVAERIGALISDLSGGVPPMLYGVVPGQSMSLILGDPQPDDPQTRIPLEATQSAAERVGELIDLEGDHLHSRAVQLGAPARRYDELAVLVQAEGVTMSWAPRNAPLRELTPERAGRQHVRLAVAPEMRVHELTLNGVLYRVIAEPGRTAGRIGIHLFDWSVRPPGPHRRVALVDYDDDELHAAIRDGLIGEPVAAVVRVKQPRPGTTIDPRHVELELASITRGPGEASALGISIDELLEEESG